MDLNVETDHVINIIEACYKLTGLTDINLQEQGGAVKKTPIWATQALAEGTSNISWLPNTSRSKMS